MHRYTYMYSLTHTYTNTHAYIHTSTKTNLRKRVKYGWKKKKKEERKEGREEGEEKGLKNKRERTNKKNRTIFEIKIEQLSMIACLLVLFLGWSPEFSVCWLSAAPLTYTPSPQLLKFS